MNTHLREPLKKAHLVSGVQSNGLRIPFPCSHTGERDDTIQKGKKLFLPTAHPSRGFWGVKMSGPIRTNLSKDEAKSSSICDDIRKIIQISFAEGARS